jgi:two-component system phosphate regulon sensor histidine kinase PhoR
VRGDEDRLGQVLINLLHNAVKFSPEGGEVVVGVREGEGEVLVWVRDPGIGVPSTDRVRIFERFYKVDRARVRGRGGTGLGLSIARHVVESHGGRIWVESEEGEGSTFTFTIPLAPATTSPATTSPATTSPAAVSGAIPEARPGA